MFNVRKKMSVVPRVLYSNARREKC